MFLRVALWLLRRFAAAFFLRIMLGGSKCWRRLASAITASCCTRLVKRRRNASKLSPSLILSSTKMPPGFYFFQHMKYTVCEKTGQFGGPALVHGLEPVQTTICILPTPRQ